MTNQLKLLDTLHNVASLLSSEHAADLVKEQDGVKGVMSLLVKVLRVSVLPQLLKDEEVGDHQEKVISTFSKALTNALSYSECASECIETPGLVKDLCELWFGAGDLKHRNSFLNALCNLSTDVRNRALLLKCRPSILKEVCGAIKKHRKDEEALGLYISFLANMTASREARRLMLDPSDYEILEDIFCCLNPRWPEQVRLGVSRIIKHLTADVISHEYLLGDVVNILPTILLPLAGNETFDDDEYSDMPPELQYLDETKEREQNHDIKQNLLAALLQLCRLKGCRMRIRDANAYLILRELHKGETQDDTFELIESIVDLLIRKEEEILEGDFVDFEVPPIEDWISGKWTYPDDGEVAWMGATRKNT